MTTLDDWRHTELNSLFKIKFEVSESNVFMAETLQTSQNFEVVDSWSTS